MWERTVQAVGRAQVDIQKWGSLKRQWTVILQFVWSIESRKGKKVGNKLRELGFMVPPH